MHTPTPSAGKFYQLVAFRIILMLLAAILFVFLAIKLRVLIVSLLFALTLASAIAPVAEWGETRKIPRPAMVAFVYIAVALMYSAVAITLAPTVREQATNLYQNLPSYMSGLQTWFESIKEMAGDKAQAMKLDQQLLQSVAVKLGHETLDLSAGLLELVLNGLLVLFLTAYFVVEAKDIWAKLALWVPPEKRDRIMSLIPPLSARMGGYVRGQILVSIAVATFLGVGLTLLQVKYSLILGMIAGLFNLVPFVGSMSALIFSLVVSFNQSVFLGGATIGLFALEQWVESNFIVPHLLGGQVDLHPLIVFFAIVIGATLMGVPGALVAVPTASALVFLAQEFYMKPLNHGTTDSGEPADVVASEPLADAN